MTVCSTPARPGPGPPPRGPRLQPTIQKALEAVRAAGGPISAAEIADHPGISGPTAQRYLSALERKGLLSLNLKYGNTGRPLNSYAAP